MSILVNILIYQVVWFLCIVLGNIGGLFSLILLAVHLYYSPVEKDDLVLMLLFLCFGMVIDGTLYHLGYIQLKEYSFPIPFWLMIVWIALATLPNHSLKWLKKRYLICTILGGLAGPLAYWAGVKMGAASFTLPLLQSLLLYAFMWALLWPVVMYLVKFLEQSGRSEG